MQDRQNIGRLLRKGYQDLRIRSAAAFVFAFVWWGALYPELCFADGTCVEVSVCDGQETVTGQADYSDIMDAEGGDIVLGSRLLEWLEQKINEE